MNSLFDSQIIKKYKPHIQKEKETEKETKNTNLNLKKLYLKLLILHI